MQVSDVVFGNRAFSSDVTAVMLVYQYKRMLNLFFRRYTNMAADFSVSFSLRDWVKIHNRGH